MPHKIEDIPLLVVRQANSENPKYWQYPEVRKAKVKRALEYLIKNNKHYRDITISQENLDALPECDIPRNLPTVTVDLLPEDTTCVADKLETKNDVSSMWLI